MLASVTVLVGDRDSEREAQFPLASLVHTVGRHVRAVRGEFVLHSLTLLLDGDYRRCKVTCATNHPFIVEATISEQQVDFEGMGADAVERVLDRVGLLLVAANIGKRQRHWLTVRDDVGGAVAVTGRGSVDWRGFAKFTAVLVGGAVVRIIDEVDGDGS
jgi:hypothetical protein